MKIKLNKANKAIFLILGAWLIIRFFVFGSSWVYLIVGTILILIVIYNESLKRKNKKG